MPIDLEIVSPEKLLLSKSVDMAVIPGSEGEIGALPGHAPMIVLLRGGTIRLYSGNAVTETLYVSGGFAEIAPTRVTVLANEATEVAALKRTEGEARLAAAEAEYQAAHQFDTASLNVAQAKIQAARAYIDAAPAA
jgi:F-type H+-transporting ATPase subunit epsilon